MKRWSTFNYSEALERLCIRRGIEYSRLLWDGDPVSIIVWGDEETIMEIKMFLSILTCPGH